MARYTDGTWTTAQQDGPKVRMIDANTRSLIFEEKYMQTAEDWAPIALDTTNTEGAFLVHESDPQSLDCGILSWTRTFAEVPSGRDEYGEYIHSAQYAVAGQLLEISIKTTARFNYQYFHTDDPTEIGLLRATRVGVSGEFIYVIYPLEGGLYPEDGTERVAEDSKLTRWKWQANIWELLTIYVVQPALEDLVVP